RPERQPPRGSLEKVELQRERTAVGLLLVRTFLYRLPSRPRLLFATYH
ncbi:unnamed protein product, partial [Ectocarpus sp. 4 AP-2014]